jgi:hypothetical protein
LIIRFDIKDYYYGYWVYTISNLTSHFGPMEKTEYNDPQQCCAIGELVLTAYIYLKCIYTYCAGGKKYPTIEQYCRIFRDF